MAPSPTARPTATPPEAENLFTGTATPTFPAVAAAAQTPVSDEPAQPPAGEQPVPADARPGFIIDHRAIEQFDRIPAEYLAAASELRFLLRHASIGVNINDGLDCLMNNFERRRPNFCDRRMPPEQVLYDEQYDRRNWIFEARGNPGWWDKANDFIERTNGLPPGETFDAAGFTFGYVDAYVGSDIDNKFFNNDPTDNFPSVEELEALETAHPDITFVWWTMGLARRSTLESQNFNRQLRAYAENNDKVLMDLADIESHQPDGAPCFDNNGQGIEAICEAYTDEVDSGHLNALGRQRLAKAMWVLMARLAGWEG